ncbi:MAG: 50S ribosomal protein L23 [Clostridiales bacterium]|nr:50S ribosomal protein L23 [Clostridiales bacterium]MBP5417768.1 50S ribosomal protein L23 [Clostridiales bacterium]
MSKAPQDIIIKPVITEKSSYDAALGKYTFQVAKTATKTDVRKAVEQLFDVKVVSVNTVNYDGKKKRQRYVEGTTASFKKAVVTIDMEAKEVSYLGKGGKTAKSDKKYKTAIEEFGIGQ